jgi:hypothetical protein
VCGLQRGHLPNVLNFAWKISMLRQNTTLSGDKGIII